jgi:deoxyadenosine/deoxycytidine kinase
VPQGIHRLADLVRLYREALPLSQEELARRVRPKTNRSAIAHLEQALRVPSSSVLRGICTYLRIPEPIWLPFESGLEVDIGPNPTASLLTVAGIMGSGKTTLSKRLAPALGLTYISESSLGARFLDDLARNRDRWAFDTQLAFLTQKAIAVENAMERGARVLVDRSIHEDVQVFARHFYECGHIDARSFAVYEEIARHFLERLPAPDIMLYCRCAPDIAVERIRGRGRPDVPLHNEDHVREISRRYDAWISSYTGSTVLELNTEVFDVRETRGVQTVAAELEQFLADTPLGSSQIDLFEPARSIGVRPPPGVLRVLFRGPRQPPRPTLASPVRLPYPTAYLAAPFTSRARTDRNGRRTLFPIGQPEGLIGRGSYRTALLDIARALRELGVDSVLPHRDLNKWGKKSLTPAEVMRACTAHVASADVFVGVLGLSHGAHYEFGVARGMGKPSIVIRCMELGESFIGSGIEESAEVLLLHCRRVRDVGAVIRSNEARTFLRRHIVGIP